MKTTLLILLSTCCGLLAQTPDSGNDDGSDASVRDALLRAIVRQTPVTNEAAGSTAPASPVAASALARPVSPAPGFPPGQAPDALLARQPATAPVIAPASAQPLALASVAPVVPAGPPEEATNYVDFSGMDIDDFLNVYSGLVDRTVLHGAGLQSPPLTLKTEKPLTKTELIEAMQTVLTMNGVSVIDQGDRFVKAVMASEALQQAPYFSTIDASNLPESDKFVVQEVKLKFMHPSDMVAILQPFSKTGSLIPIDNSQTLFIKDYAGNVKRMLEIVSDVDMQVSSEFESEIIPIKYAQAEDIANALSSLGGQTATGIPRGASATSGGGGGGGGGRIGGPGGTGTYGAGNTGTVSTPLGGAGAANTANNTSFAQRLRTAVNQLGGGTPDFKLFTGVTRILPDSRANSLLVFANATDMQIIKRIVHQLDVYLPQVLIEALIMEVNLDDEQNLGVSYLQQNPSTAKNFTGIGAIQNGPFLNQGSFTSTATNIAGLASGLSYAAQFGNNFDATLTAAATDSRVNVLSRPSVQTSQNVAAEFKVGNTIPYVTSTYDTALTGGVAQSQYTQTFVGIDLNVTPLINSDGLVSLDITQDIQQLGPTTDISGTAVPSTTERYAKATVSVRDRDTVILGGFISNTKSKALSGVPGLMKIPVLGALFRSSNDSLQKDELIVLIRPSVLPTPESAAIVARKERDGMPLVKSAERQYRLEENRQLKQADAVVVPEERAN